MALVPGTRLGVYEITAQIGEGGMGAVYRATDTSLSRQVAIKVLPDAFAEDPDRLARFEREAKTLASLNHPHIAAIYAVEKSAGLHALVMELVEGEDLSQRTARGAIPLDEALPIAKQIAEALEAAHEQGIIHRDLKPANIKVRADGTVKVLDFGLAKAMEPATGSSRSMSMSPTITTPAMTQAGMILGTAAYMSPEQARGGMVDKRADVWAFGVVLFEMLTARRLFEGATVSDTLALVLTKEPDWTTLPAKIPAPISRLLRRCLEKDRKRRLTDAGAARLEIEEALTASAGDTGRASAPVSRPLPIALAVAAMVIIALAIPTVRHLRETPPAAPPETRLDIVTPSTDRPLDFALSPDGRQIAFVASGDGAPRVWLRSLGTTTARPLPGTEGGSSPFWAPDSRSIGFFSSNGLKRIDLNAGAPQTLVTVVNPAGATWSTDGVILFASSTGAPLARVAATGGVVTTITKPGSQQTFQRTPQFLPDGHRFLFSVGGAPDVAGIYLGKLDESAVVRLTSAEGGGVFVPDGQTSLALRTLSGPQRAEASGESGWLLWVRAGTLVAQRLDVAKAVLTGEPVTVADVVATDSGRSRSAVSVAATGLVAYRAGGSIRRQLTWLDRSGTARGTVADPDDKNLNQPRISPDGHRVAVYRTVEGNSDIWLLDGVHMGRTTFDAATEQFPVWSPNGTRIAFESSRTRLADIYQKPPNSAGVEELVVSSDQVKAPSSWSKDGRFLLYRSIDPQTNSDLWVLPMALREPQGHAEQGRGMERHHTPWVFLKTPFSEVRAEFSPDSAWVAYESNESGRTEVYVRPFVPPSRDASADKATRAASTSVADGQVQISATGGIEPVWRPDGKELFYLNPAGTMMAAPITVSGGILSAGAPVALFPTHIVGGGLDTGAGRQYDVAPDGRFLINTVLNEVAAPITIIQNWNPEARK